MFQYSLGKRIALETGGALLLDVSLFDGRKWDFGLKDFALMDNVILSSRKNIAALTKIKVIKYLRKMGLGSCDPLLWGVLMEPFPPEYVDIPYLRLGNNDTLFLEGLWQSERYFDRYADEIRRDFTLNEISPAALELRERISSEGSSSVSVHIRRGDYVTDPSANRVHGVLPPDYYRKSEDLIRSVVDRPVFFIFSDDIEWAKTNFRLNGDMVFVSDPGRQACEELFLMSCCAHNIIANSSYSWWGAWLNDNPSRVVVTPEKWFQNMRSDHIVPDRWKRV